MSHNRFKEMSENEAYHKQLTYCQWDMINDFTQKLNILVDIINKLEERVLIIEKRLEGNIR